MVQFIYQATFCCYSTHAENEKNLQSDAWRLFQLEKASARPGHDWQKFGTGNRQTLETDPTAKGIKVHQALLDFHAKHYSANIMGLSVLGKVTTACALVMMKYELSHVLRLPEYFQIYPFKRLTFTSSKPSFVIPQESLDKLQEMVVNMFSGVENKSVEIKEWSEHPYGEEQVGVRGYIVPVKVPFA